MSFKPLTNDHVHDVETERIRKLSANVEGFQEYPKVLYHPSDVNRKEMVLAQNKEEEEAVLASWAPKPEPSIEEAPRKPHHRK